MATFVAEEYIAWVKRSLNRFLGDFLVTDGTKNQDYLDQVKTWRWINGMTESEVVDEAVQDTLIRANHSDNGYAAWVRKALVAASVDPSLPSSGAIDQKVRAAIMSYQAFNGLRDDGWIGYYTETQLIKDTKIDPPGTKRHPTPPKKPSLPPKTPVDPKIETNRLLKVMSLQVYHRTDPGANFFPDPVERGQVRCLTWKLAHPNGMDFSFLTQRTVLDYCNGSGSNTFATGTLPSEVTTNLQKDLLVRVQLNRHLTYWEQVEKYQTNLLFAYREVLLGINQIHAEYGIDGDIGGGARYMERFLADRYKMPSSILYCFRGE